MQALLGLKECRECRGTGFQNAIRNGNPCDSCKGNGWKNSHQHNIKKEMEIYGNCR